MIWEALLREVYLFPQIMVIAGSTRMLGWLIMGSTLSTQTVYILLQAQTQVFSLLIMKDQHGKIFQPEGR